MKKQILILAGTYKQFLDYVESRRLTDIKHGETYYHYGDLPNQLLGRRFDDMVITGTFWNRGDACELERLGKRTLY
jgi:hypothetical protein